MTAPPVERVKLWGVSLADGIKRRYLGAFCFSAFGAISAVTLINLLQPFFLRGLLPICASCKNFRDDSGYGRQVETYVRQHT